jgi:hypothetical protein
MKAYIGWVDAEGKAHHDVVPNDLFTRAQWLSFGGTNAPIIGVLPDSMTDRQVETAMTTMTLSRDWSEENF